MAFPEITASHIYKFVALFRIKAIMTLTVKESDLSLEYAELHLACTMSSEYVQLFWNNDFTMDEKKWVGIQKEIPISENLASFTYYLLVVRQEDSKSDRNAQNVNCM